MVGCHVSSLFFKKIMIMAKGLPPLRQNLPKNLAAPPTPRHMIERLTLGDVVYLHHQALEKMAKSLELHC